MAVEGVEVAVLGLESRLVAGQLYIRSQIQIVLMGVISSLTKSGQDLGDIGLITHRCDVLSTQMGLGNVVWL